MPPRWAAYRENRGGCPDGDARKIGAARGPFSGSLRHPAMGLGSLWTICRRGPVFFLRYRT